MRVIEGRRDTPEEGSYTNKLLEGGDNRILKKIGEESAEFVMACKDNDADEIAGDRRHPVPHASRTRLSRSELEESAGGAGGPSGNHGVTEAANRQDLSHTSWCETLVSSKPASRLTAPLKPCWFRSTIRAPGNHWLRISPEDRRLTPPMARSSLSSLELDGGKTTELCHRLERLHS